MSERKLKKIGKYDVLDILGRGGMGVIYKAIDPAIGRLVAIKMITGAFSEDPDLLKRFYREAQSTGTLQHPNIVTVYELGDLEGTPYLVMEFLDGEGLDKAIAQKRHLALVEKLAMGVQICHGLSYAHQRGVIHRDIKPANIVVLQSGSIKIVDFGIARIGNDQLTKPGQVVGSIHYMSPEQINAIPVDARTDIFSAGVLLYELLTYTLPFQGLDTFSTLMKILNQEAPPLNSVVPELPAELNDIVQQALAKDRELRYSSIDDLSFDLNRVLDRLKEEIIARYLSVAEAHVNNAEWTKAKEQIGNIFRIDRQNTRANMLNREITSAMQREQIKAQIKEHRLFAEQALSQHRYDDALASLDQALALRKTDPTIIRMRDSVEAARDRAVKFTHALNAAHEAHDAGDLEEAQAAVARALEIEPDNPEARSLLAIVRREIEERNRQSQIEALLLEARKQMTARQFSAAIETLQSAEVLDPGSSRIHDLVQQANLALEQDRRRKQLEAFCTEIEESINRDEFHTAYQKSLDGLKVFPEDRGLLKLRDLAAKQVELKLKREFVEAQIKTTRQLLEEKRNSEALKVIEQALQRYPTEPALTSQMTLVQQIVQREREEAEKREFVDSQIRAARQLLDAKKSTEALAVIQKALERYPDELALASQLTLVIDIIGHEQKELEKRQFLDSQIKQSRQLLDLNKSSDALAVIREALNRYPGESALSAQLALINEIVSREHEERRRHEFVHSAKESLRKKDFEAAIRTLETAHEQFESTEIVDLLQLARERAATAVRQKKIEEITSRAQARLDCEEYAEAVDFLEQSLREIPDDDLQQHLTEAKEAVSAFERRIDEAIAGAARLAKARKTGEAVRFLEEQPASFKRAARFRDALEGNAREHQKMLALNATKSEIQRTVAKRDFAAAFRLLENIRTECSTLPEFGECAQELETARQQVANIEIEKAVHDARLVLLVRSFDAALKLLDEASELLAYARPELQAEFQSLRRDAADGKEKQVKEARDRTSRLTAADQISTRIVGSSNTSTEDAHWSSAATATPIPQELTRLEASILRECDLMKLRDLLDKSKNASFDQVGSIEEQTEAIGELYSDDPEFAELVTEVLDRLAELEKGFRPSVPGLPAECPEQPLGTEENATQPCLPPNPDRETVAMTGGFNNIPTSPAEPPQTIDFPSGVLEETSSLRGEASLPAGQTITGGEALPENEADVPSAPRPRERKQEGKKEKKRKKDHRSSLTAPPSERRPEAVEVPSPPTVPLLQEAPELRHSTAKPLRYRYYIAYAAGAALLVIVVLIWHSKSTPRLTSTSPAAPTLIEVKINSAPEEASVRVNDQVCTTPQCTLKLAPGTYDVTAELPGYETTHQQVSINAGQSTASVLVNLTPVHSQTSRNAAKGGGAPPLIEKRASISFTGAPSSTSVKIDGSSVGQIGDSGSLSIEVSPGMHRLELQRAGYEPLKLKRRVGAQQSLQLGPKDLAFSPSPVNLRSSSAVVPATPPSIAGSTAMPSANNIKLPSPPVPAPPDPANAEWDRIVSTKDQAALVDFIKRYPSSSHVAEASRKLDDLRAESARAIAATELANNRSAVENTLDRYAQAYRDRNVANISAIWPSLGKSELKKIQDAFKAASAVQMSLHPLKAPDINGDRAVVVCSRSLQYTFPQGGAKPLQDTVTVQMHKQNGLWVIEKVD